MEDSSSSRIREREKVGVEQLVNPPLIPLKEAVSPSMSMISDSPAFSLVLHCPPLVFCLVFLTVWNACFAPHFKVFHFVLRSLTDRGATPTALTAIVHSFNSLSLSYAVLVGLNLSNMSSISFFTTVKTAISSAEKLAPRSLADSSMVFFL